MNVSINKDKMLGRIAAASDYQGWLLQRDGRLSKFQLDQVTDFTEVDPKFVPMSMVDLRDHLKSELGRNYEVKTTNHYVVGAIHGVADRYAGLFEQVYRQCHTYFGTRGLRMEEPEFPLVAIVLPDQATFIKYCQTEGANPPNGVVGLYLTGSNRVVLFDRPATGSGLDSGVDATVIHEATHQVAFNTGIHTRIGQNPQWLVEGLATLFEADGIRARQVGNQAIDRINPERHEWFRQFRSQRRKSGSLEAFVREDNLFKRSPLDAYSQAWALTFYLVETRQAEFARYLRTIAAHDPLMRYDSETRVKEFRDSFGRDLEFVENEFLRFHDRLSE